MQPSHLNILLSELFDPCLGTLGGGLGAIFILLKKTRSVGLIFLAVPITVLIARKDVFHFSMPF